MTTEGAVQGYGELVAAIRRGRHVVWVSPPQAARAEPVWAALAERLDSAPGAGVRSLVAVPNRVAGRDVTSVAAGLLVTGLRRAERAIRSNTPLRLVATPEDILALLTRAALKLDAVDHVVLAWPESLLADNRAEALDQLLAELRDRPRVLLAWDVARLASLIERHAHRAAVVRASGADAPPVDAPCRYLVIGPEERDRVLEHVLDALDPERPLVWRLGDPLPAASGHDLVVASDPPTADELRSLAGAGTVIALVTATQLPYLQSICARAQPVRLPARADEARTQAASLRERIAMVAAESSLEAELGLLEPLFERFDSAEVAAALVRLYRGERSDGDAPTGAEGTRWAKVFLNAGKRDRVRPSDLVGALINEVGLVREEIGRIEVRDTHATVEIAAARARETAERLNRVVLRGRRVAARLDRKP